MYISVFISFFILSSILAKVVTVSTNAHLIMKIDIYYNKLLLHRSNCKNREVVIKLISTNNVGVDIYEIFPY